jgi:hypothetical protein
LQANGLVPLVEGDLGGAFFEKLLNSYLSKSLSSKKAFTHKYSSKNSSELKSVL